MILILGRGGQLGTSFANLLGPGARSLGMDELNLQDFDTIWPTLDRFRTRRAHQLCRPHCGRPCRAAG